MHVRERQIWGKWRPFNRRINVKIITWTIRWHLQLSQRLQFTIHYRCITQNTIEWKMFKKSISSVPLTLRKVWYNAIVGQNVEKRCCRFDNNDFTDLIRYSTRKAAGMMVDWMEHWKRYENVWQTDQIFKISFTNRLPLMRNGNLTRENWYAKKVKRNDCDYRLGWKKRYQLEQTSTR